MTQKVDRREAMTGKAKKPAKAATGFVPTTLPYESMFPHTQYFEVDSVKADARYAIWITVPKSYGKDPKRSFPVVFSPDGNSSRGAPATAGLSDLSDWDYIDAYQATIQVSVGYPPADADKSLAVRARDLLPPKEYLMPGTEEGVMATAKAGVLDQAGAELYLKYLRDPAGDRFLAFLNDELYPFVTANYRIQSDTVGLFGHSYGGLFATYAALQKKTIFKNIGASSPGILPEHSVIFQLYKDALAAGSIQDRNLFMSIATREITDPTVYQSMVGAGTAEFMRTVGTTPLKGLNFSTLFIENESHITVKTPAMHAFLRRFYQRKA